MKCLEKPDVVLGCLRFRLLASIAKLLDANDILLGVGKRFVTDTVVYEWV